MFHVTFPENSARPGILWERVIKDLLPPTSLPLPPSWAKETTCLCGASKYKFLAKVKIQDHLTLHAGLNRESPPNSMTVTLFRNRAFAES